ncbi:hypothetical protein OIU79_000043 [Salix purpurea]|uniref:Uncharacterized protein n=1 Tax=Salix purpurea TaxID=77065 RepID=A0A9Q0ZMD5_SALPP|nr:hypothetical protein OIU79_000043 [Salix purpurea]
MVQIWRKFTVELLLQTASAAQGGRKRKDILASYSLPEQEMKLQRCWDAAGHGAVERKVAGGRRSINAVAGAKESF